MVFLMKIVAIITVLFLEIPCFEAVNAVKVAAFNVQVFGQTKISKKYVREILAKIVSRYDIILIQEIRDSGNMKDAIKILLEDVNELTQKSGSSDYEMIISERLGRSVSKEQYAFLYRKSIATVKAHYTYLDSNDDFEREPYVVHFHVSQAAVSDMVFIAIHTKPDDAASEVDKLVDVYDDAVKRWKINNIVIMGDLNAACSYVRDTDWGNIRLATDKRFWWLIDDCEDTTVKGSKCAYDRFIATGDYLLKNIVAESPRLFDFKSAHKLNIHEAEDVSDHFPIEFEIKKKGWKEEETMDYVLHSDLSGVGKNDVYNILRSHKNRLSKLHKKSGGTAEMMFTTTKDNIPSAITCVQDLQGNFTKIMGDIQADQAERYLKRLQSDVYKHSYQVFSSYRNVVDVKIRIQLIWNVEQIPITCRLVVSKYL